MKKRYVFQTLNLKLTPDIANLCQPVFFKTFLISLFVFLAITHSSAYTAPAYFAASHAPIITKAHVIAHSATLKPIKTSMQKTDFDANAHPDKHCISQIKIKTQNIFQFEGWYKKAKSQSKQNWQEKVKKRFGSVYSSWPISINKKDNCTRIGITRTETGEVGVYVLCSISAIPCTKLNP